MRLTWAQFVWGVATLVLLCSAWFDLRAQVSRVADGLEGHDRRIGAIEARNSDHGFTREDAAKLRDEIVRAVRR